MINPTKHFVPPVVLPPPTSLNRCLIVALLAFAVCAPGASVSAQTGGVVTFSDSTFSDSEWELTVRTLDTGGSLSAIQKTAGGNPGSYRSVVLHNERASSGNTFSGVWGLHRKKGARYDLKTNGSIAQIDYSEDALRFGEAGRFQASGPAVWQAGQVYVWTSRFLTDESVWTKYTKDGLTSADFVLVSPSGLSMVNINSHPDFSANGEALEFGFFRWNTTSFGGDPSDSVCGIDNWQVVVKPVAPLTSGLVAWWPGDGNALDLVSTNHGSLMNGAKATTLGKVGQAFDFDGNNSAVRMPSSALNNAFASLSVEAWVFPRKHGNAGGINSAYGYAIISRTEDAGFAVRVHDGYLQADLRLSGGAALITFSQAQLPTNAWSHIAMTYDGSAVQGFLNGQLLSSAAASGTVRPSTVELLIGNEPNDQPGSLGPGFGWNGLIDEVSIYNRALSAEEIAANYAAFQGQTTVPLCTEPPSGLVAWWTGNGTANDALGQNDGTLQNGATFAPGKVGQAFKLDGEDDYVTLGVLPELKGAKSLTIVAWINMADYSNSVGSIVGKWNSFPANNDNSFLLDAEVKKGRFALNFDDSTGEYLEANTQIPTNEWLHIAATWRSSDGAAVIYKNGIPDGQLTIGAGKTLRYHENYPAVIGEFGVIRGTPYKFHGLIDEVAIFNRALSALEVQSIYNAGSVGMCLPQSPPIIVTQPQNQTVTAGQSVTFTVTATGVAPLRYQWLRDGANISGATNATLTLNNVTLSHSGGYSVIVSNASAAGGSTTSDLALLTVNPAGSPPVITVQPRDQFGAPEGVTVTFSVTATGTKSLSYQWQKNDIDLPGATSSTLALTNVKPSNGGSYTVIVSNAFGREVSSPAILSVAPTPVPPTITLQPQSQTVTVGGSVTFRVTAMGIATLSYQWRKDGVNLAGATDATLTLNNVAASQAGTYTVVVGLPGVPVNPVTSNPAILTVNPALAAPAITQQPPGATVTAGQSVTFSVTAAGNPTPTYQWRKNGANISGATSATYAIATATANDAGTYTVVVSNSQGSVTSATATLTVNPALTAPTITQQPQNQTVTTGQSVTFSVTASGNPAPAYQWRKNGANISAATSAAYTIGNATANDAGAYTVVVSNSQGSITSATATLAVNPLATAPVITAQPQNVTVTAGASATFTVTAAGTAPLSYQWRKDGAAIAGATGSTLTLSNVQSSNVGSYTVVVTNSAGSITSAAATLAIQAASSVFVERQLPSSYSAGTKLTVTLRAVPATGTSVYAVEDHPPGGWTVGAISDAGSYDSNNQTVKFGPFFDSTSRNLTYEVTPPAGVTGAKQFSGKGSIDGVDVVIGGSISIDVAQRHPADYSPADDRLVIGEVTAYGAAWRKGSTWPIGPNPIPINYLTRAGTLWKNGETYRFDSSITSPPLWWVNVTAAKAGGGTLSLLGMEREKSAFSALSNGESLALTGSSPSLRSERGEGRGEESSLALYAATTSASAQSTLPDRFVPGEPFNVQISVKPAPGASVYAVEDRFPAGWKVSNISNSGELDPLSGSVKWGPFFDSTPRELSYSILPALEAGPEAAFNGEASFDGAGMSVAGQRQSRATSRLGVLKLLSGGKMQLEIRGGTGARYSIEVSSNLRDWASVGAFSPTAGVLVFDDPGTASRSQSFYRTIRQ